MDWRIDTRFRYGVRTQEPFGIATLQQQHDFLSTYELTDSLSAQLGTRMRFDGAYLVNRSRYQALEQNDPPDFELRELNLEYRNGPVLLRIGNQLIVWGEAFGSFFADVVNPKELRESGLGELIDLRRPSEIINFQFISDRWSLQTIYQPFYRVNRIPRPESDFFPKAAREELNRTGLDIDFRNQNDPEDQNGDLGFRFQAQLGTVDFSVFYFDHIDRQPVVRSQLISPDRLNLRTQSFRTAASGLTFTAAGDRLVVRGEMVYFQNRAFALAEGGLPFDPTPVNRAHQLVAVIGADYSFDKSLSGWQVGLQLIHDQLDRELNVLRSQREVSMALLLQKTGSESWNSRVFSAYSMSDGSFLTQAGVFAPFNDQLEMGVDLWHFIGTDASQFGSFQSASRFFFVIKGVFSG